MYEEFKQCAVEDAKENNRWVRPAPPLLLKVLLRRVDEKELSFWIVSDLPSGTILPAFNSSNYHNDLENLNIHQFPEAVGAQSLRGGFPSPPWPQPAGTRAVSR